MSTSEQPRLLDVSLPLNNGMKIPKYSFGTWKLDAKLAEEVVGTAIASGYRHIDCARVYQNEETVGAALEKNIMGGKVSRADLWITSKLWNSDHHPAQVESACRKTIEDLKVGYLDLYLIHWPVHFLHKDDPSVFSSPENLFPKNEHGGVDLAKDVTIEDTWRAMEALVEKGLVKSIGVSNFSTAQVDAVLKIAKIKPVVNQVELHVALPQTRLRHDMQERGIVVEAYSPLGFGLSTEKSLMDDVEVEVMAKKCGMSPANFLLSFVGSLPNVCLLTKSQTASRIKDNAALKIVEFPADVKKDIETYGIQNAKRTVNPDFFQEKKGELFFKDHVNQDVVDVAAHQ